MSTLTAAQAGRPRDPAVEEAILRATRDLLVERGVAGTTVEAVARAAGSGKAAVYRRWPSKTALVIAATRDLLPDAPVPDTGSLRDDLLECALYYARADQHATRVLASVLREAGVNEAFHDAVFIAIGRPPASAFATVMERWRARGDVSDSAPVDLLTTLVPSVAFGNVMRRRRALDEQTAVDLVDGVLLPALRTAPANAS